MALSFLTTQLLAMILSIPFKQTGFQAFEDPNNPINPLIYVVAIVCFSAVILLIVRLKRAKLITYLILGATALVLMDVFMIIIAFGLYYGTGIETYLWESSMAAGLALGIALTYALYKNPEWHVVNTVGILMGAGVASIMGISFGILPVIIFLIALAIYDAIAVYKTKHMISLADAVTEQHLPVLLVYPKDEGYSFKKQKGIKKELDSGKEREALFMGLGDIIIPSVLAVSAFSFLAPVASLGTLGPFLVALGTMLGIMGGFACLMVLVMKGKPQAGLPLLNAGAILGYLLSYIVVYGNFSFGFALWW